MPAETMDTSPPLIRSETDADHASVRTVNLSAFETPAEADLVDALREQAAPVFSLVAEDDGTVVGHIMFSPVTLSGHADVNVMGLAPMAVESNHQRQGVGSALIEAGLGQCRRSGVDAVIVLGYPDYYTRFGFVPASRFGIESEYDVPDDVFMALELHPEALSGKGGTAKYHAVFSNV